MNHSEIKKFFNNLSFSTVLTSILRVKNCFLQFLVDILPLGFGIQKN